MASDLLTVNARQLCKRLGIAKRLPLRAITTALSTLSPREEKVMRMTLNGYLDADIRRECTRVCESGHAIPITQERLEQVRNKAIRKLGHSSRLGQYK